MKTDDRLRRDLEAAYGRDLPGEEFDRRVMETIDAEGAGGESELTVPVGEKRRMPLGVLLVAASVLLLIIGLLRLRSNDEPVAAGPGEESEETEIKITWKNLGNPIAVGAEDFRFGGRIVKSDGLATALAGWVEELREAGNEDPAVAVAAEGGLPWRHVHEAVLRLADPRVRVWKIRFAIVDREKGSVGPVVPLDLPKDAGLAPGSRPRREHDVPGSVELSRARGEGETRVVWSGVELGREKAGLAILRKRLEGEDSEHLPAVVEIRAWGSVPFGQVTDLMMLLRSVGISKLHLTGDAPETFMIKVSLQPKDGRTVMYLDREDVAGVSHGVAHRRGRRQMYELEDGLIELARRIKAARADGRKPHGFLSARIYVDQTAVKQVMKVFEENGVKDVIRLN